MYLLTCSQCQASVPVSPAQAGDEISCPACAQAVRVPKLGELRQLPLADQSATAADAADVAVATSSAGTNTGFVIFGLIATISLLIASFCGIRWALVKVPTNTTEHIDQLREAYKVAAPAELIREWESMERYGVDIVSSYSYQRLADEKRTWGNNSVIAGAVGGLSILAAWGLTRAGRRSRSKVAA